MARRLLALAFSTVLAVTLAGCASDAPSSTDSDRDGLSDSEERAGWTITLRRADGNDTRKVTSDPTRPDSDGDGVGDAEEQRRGSDPREVDSDGDGLLDGKSMGVLDTSDLGRAFANWSIVHDRDAKDRWLGETDLCAEQGGLSPTRWDSDRPLPDGIGDGEEIMGWEITVRGETRRVFSSPCASDSDGDGLNDGAERARALDPSRKDTDDDGAWDSVDADPLFDLGVRATVGTLELFGPLGNATRVRVLVNIEGHEQSYERNAVQNLEIRFNTATTANVDDATGPGQSSLPVPVVVRVLLVAADGYAWGADLGGPGDGGTLEFRYDLVSGEWRDGGATGTGELVHEGPAGTLTLAFSKADF